MTKYTTHVAIIVPANKRQAASGRVAAWSGDSDSTNVFSVPLSATGQTPATHWGCQVPIKQSVLDGGALAALENSTQAVTLVVRTGVGTPNEQVTGDFWEFAQSGGLFPAWEIG